MARYGTRLFVLIELTLFLVEGDNDTVVAENDLHVDDGLSDGRLEDVEPFAGRPGSEAFNEVAPGESRQDVTGVVFVEPEAERRQLAFTVW